MKQLLASVMFALAVVGCAGVYVSPATQDVNVTVLAVERDCLPYSRTGCVSMKITNHGTLPFRVDLWPIQGRNFAHGHARNFECRAKGEADARWVSCYTVLDLLIEPPSHYRVGEGESEVIWVELPMQMEGKEIRVELIDQAGNGFRSNGFGLPRH